MFRFELSIPQCIVFLIRITEYPYFNEITAQLSVMAWFVLKCILHIFIKYMDHSYHQKLYILKCRFDFQVSNSSGDVSTLIHQMELTYVSYHVIHTVTHTHIHTDTHTHTQKDLNRRFIIHLFTLL